MLASICATVHDKIGIMMLESFKDKEAVGLYNMAARIPDSLPFLASIFIASVFPVMVRHRETDPVAFDRIYRRSARYLLLFIVPVAGFCTLTSPDILNLLFPGRIPEAMFGHASGTLVLLVWAMVFKYVGTAFSFLIIAVGQEKRRLICLGAAALLGILLNIILIPAHHILGSATAVLVGSIAYPIVGALLPAIAKIRDDAGRGRRQTSAGNPVDRALRRCHQGSLLRRGRRGRSRLRRADLPVKGRHPGRPGPAQGTP